MCIRDRDREGLLSILESDDDRLSFYTEDSEHFYRFKVLDRAKEYTVIPFEDAEKRGVLHILREGKKVKPYKGDIDKLFVPYVKKMREKVINKEIDFSDSSSLQGELNTLPQAPSVDLSWNLVKREVRVERKKRDNSFEESLFSQEPDSWSEVIPRFEGQEHRGPLFYQVHESKVSKLPLVKSMNEAGALLGREAKLHLVRQLIKKIEDKGSLSFTKEEDGS